MLEMVQGEGGVIPMEESFVKGLEKLCRERDVLLLIDEVQTGIGRTGTFYAYQGYGVEPDVVTTAKGLAGGLPMGGLPGEQGPGGHPPAGGERLHLRGNRWPAPGPGWWWAGCPNPPSLKA